MTGVRQKPCLRQQLTLTLTENLTRDACRGVSSPWSRWTLTRFTKRTTRNRVLAIAEWSETDTVLQCGNAHYRLESGQARSSGVLKDVGILHVSAKGGAFQ
eukprot:2382798-Amphidinium_carterae.1